MTSSAMMPLKAMWPIQKAASQPPKVKTELCMHAVPGREVV